MSAPPASPRRGRRLLAVAALALALAGCALAPPGAEISAQGEQRFEGRRAALESLQAWQLNGRAAFSGPGESGSAALHWRQQGEDYRILLRGPLGSGSLRLEGDALGATLTTSRGEQAQAADAGALLRELTGYALPVAALPYWLRGLPAPGPRQDAGFDGQGLLRQLSQAGWQVSYQEYGSFLDRLLPVRLELENGTWRVRIVVSRWRPLA